MTINFNLNSNEDGRAVYWEEFITRMIMHVTAKKERRGYYSKNKYFNNNLWWNQMEIPFVRRYNFCRRLAMTRRERTKQRLSGRLKKIFLAISWRNYTSSRHGMCHSRCCNHTQHSSQLHLVLLVPSQPFQLVINRYWTPNILHP